MSEEEKKAIETIESFIKYYKTNEQTSHRANLDVFREECQAIEFILNKYDVTQKELNNIKEIEKAHQEENGKLRVELEQYKLLEANIDKANKIIAENKFDEGLYGLLMQEKEKNNNLIKQLQEQNTEIQDISRQLRQEKEKNKVLEAKRIWNKGRIEGLKKELEQEKEKNKELEEKLKIAKQLYNDACVCITTECVEKDKIKEKIEELEKEQKEYKNSQEWEIQDDIVAQISILEELLEEK